MPNADDLRIFIEVGSAVSTTDGIKGLEKNSSNPKYDPWTINGRDSAFLDDHLGSLDAVGLSAEHGAFLRQPNHID